MQFEVKLPARAAIEALLANVTGRDDTRVAISAGRKDSSRATVTVAGVTLDGQVQTIACAEVSTEGKARARRETEALRLLADQHSGQATGPIAPELLWYGDLEGRTVVIQRAVRGRVTSATWTSWAREVVSHKCPQMAVDVWRWLNKHAVAADLILLGDGPLRLKQEGSIAKRHGYHGEVKIGRAVPHAEMRRARASCDLFLFTSFNDTSVTVILEAKARSLSVVTLDHWGAGKIVNDDCGLRGRIAPRAHVVQGLGSTIVQLAADPVRRHAMGENLRKRVEQVFTWGRKREVIREPGALAARMPS